jgi:GGDEF domain-containing protein
VRSARALFRYALPASVAVPVLSALVLLLVEHERVVSFETSIALWVELENLALGAVSLLTAFAIRAAERRRRAIEAQLEELAHRDPLTGLLNRRGLETELSRAPRDDRRELAVVLIDLDDFKRINDTRGHTAGTRSRARARDLVAALAGADEAGETVAASFGIAAGPPTAMLDELLPIADRELYAAKGRTGERRAVHADSPEAAATVPPPATRRAA